MTTEKTCINARSATRLGRLIGLGLALFSCVGAAGCGAESGDSYDEQAASSVDQPIINGTAVASDDVGLVRLTFPSGTGTGLCSSTLLNDRWLLTARHCAAAAANGYRLRIGTATTDAPARVDRIVTHPVLDVALLHTDRSVNNPATGAPFRNHLYPGAPQSLQGQTVNCRGYGRSTYLGGSGTLREANLSVIDSTDTTITTGANAAGQVQWSGDSGGPCTYTSAGLRYVLSVASNCWASDDAQTVYYCNLVGAAAFKSWAFETMGIGPHGGVMRLDSEYLAIPSGVTWENARADCESRSAHLVTLTGDAERQFVKGLIPANFNSIWIGLTDQGHEGTWTWVTGQPLYFQFWNAGEPNNAGGAENWAEMYRTGAWNDLPAGVNTAYVCEWEPHGGRTHGGFEYLGFSINRTWVDAHNDCVRARGSLLSVHDAVTDEFARAMLPGRYAWLDLTDSGHEGVWTWGDGSPVNYTHWMSGEPNNAGGAEHWAAIANYGSWNDLPVTWQLPYVCQWGLPVLEGTITGAD